jgi:pullulanase
LGDNLTLKSKDHFHQYIYTKLDHLMLQFNGEESRITNIRYSSGDLGDSVTLRVHYYRPDGDYDGWNLWLWDGSEVETTFFEAPYQFENVNGEMVCTVEVEPATNQVGYIVRYLDWVDKDIHEDQFIDITGIIDGTVDVYIQSGVKGHTIILNDDVISGVAFQSLTYSHDSQNLVLALSSVPNGNLNAELSDSNGQVTISHVARIGSYFYLTLAEPLTPGSYSLSYNTGTVLFDII